MSKEMNRTRPLYWSIRREVWEHRSLWIAPLIVTAVVMIAFIITALTGRVGRFPLIAPAPIMLATFIVGFFYCLESMRGERRDRSILFWKSMPVSDLTSVMAKVCIPFVLLPLIAFVLGMAAQGVMLLSVPRLWTKVSLVEEIVVAMYGLAVHSLWFAPVFGWFFLISAWARRAALLWAVLPFVVLAAVEYMAFGTGQLQTFLRSRFLGAMSTAFELTGKKGADEIHLSQLTPLTFLSSPALWIGLAFAAACIASVVRLRRNRDVTA